MKKKCEDEENSSGKLTVHFFSAVSLPLLFSSSSHSSRQQSPFQQTSKQNKKQNKKTQKNLVDLNRKTSKKVNLNLKKKTKM